VNVIENDEKIGQCNSVLIETEINPHEYSFRKSMLKPEKCLNISWIEVEKKNLGIGSFIILYCIFICHTKFPSIKYCVLDNDSNRSTYSQGDIYKKIGFSFIDIISFDHSKTAKKSKQKIKISGPEMQYRISNIVSNKTEHILDKIYKKISHTVK